MYVSYFYFRVSAMRVLPWSVPDVEHYFRSSFACVMAHASLVGELEFEHFIALLAHVWHTSSTLSPSDSDNRGGCLANLPG